MLRRLLTFVLAYDAESRQRLRGGYTLNRLRSGFSPPFLSHV